MKNHKGKEYEKDYMCVCVCVRNLLNKQTSQLTFACELLLPQAHHISYWK